MPILLLVFHVGGGLTLRQSSLLQCVLSGVETTAKPRPRQSGGEVRGQLQYLPCSLNRAEPPPPSPGQCLQLIHLDPPILARRKYVVLAIFDGVGEEGEKTRRGRS